MLVVAHDTVTVLVRYVCEGLTEDEVLTLARGATVGNAAITRLHRDGDGRWRALEVNDDRHLVQPDGTDLRTAHPAAPPRKAPWPTR